MSGLLEVLFYIVCRLVDLAVCILLSLMLAPTIAVVLLALAAESRQPLLVVETVRRGRPDPLRLLRFRTAIVGPFGSRHGTPVGTFLTQTRLEDAPALINVLRADVSLCGYVLNRLGQFRLGQFRRF